MLQSIAKFFVNPMFYLWTGLLVVLFLRSSKRRYLIILNTLFYVSTIPFTGWFFQKAWSVDDTFNPGLKYDAAIVLLGISDSSWYVENKKFADDFNCYYRFGPSADRILAGINFVKSGYAKKLLLGEYIPRSFNETELLHDFAMQNGLRTDQIIVYGRVERTLDEAKGVKAFTTGTSLKRLVVVTSKMHMRRALALFRKQGLNPDVYSVPSWPIQDFWQRFIPSSVGIEMTEDSLYEVVGYLGYSIKGDI